MTAAPGSPRSTRFEDDPQAYLAEDRRRALAAGGDLHDRVTGSVLFADISGFTSLTEALADELGPQRGAEVLTEVLDRVFEALLEQLHAQAGSVLYFSGDAVTCWIDGDDGTRATACALAMQEQMQRVGEVVTPAGARVVLAVKVAVAAGRARRFVVGDPAVQLIDVLAGRLMDEVAAAEGTASPGEVLVTAPVRSALGPRARTGDQRSGALGSVWVVESMSQPPAPVPLDPEPPPLPDDVVRQWLLPAVHQRLAGGRGAFLAELRPAVPLFLHFVGIDFDDDEDAPAHLDAFITAAQRVLDGYGGTLLQLTVGDKGAYLYGAFGVPVAHEDDASRACAAALELLRLDGLGGVHDLRVGVAAGRLRAGTYGHRDRRTYCCLGDSVNLAARLMGKADVGGVLVSEQVQAAAGAGFRFGKAQSLVLKGKAGTFVAAPLLHGSRGAASLAGEPALAGREDELALLQTAVREAAAGTGRLVSVCGDVGAGKSRLVAEVVAGLVCDGHRVLQGAAQPYGGSGAYLAWHTVFRLLLGVPDVRSADALTAHLDTVLPADLRPRLPLLGSLLGVPLPDNALTSTFDAKLRKSSLEQLAVRLLAEASAPRLVVLLEDTHALDALSRDLLGALVRALPGLPLAVLLTTRPAQTPLPLSEWGRWAAVTELSLEVLSEKAVAALATEQLQVLWGDDDPPLDDLVPLVVARSEGNPLWVRELCRYLRERRDERRSGPVDAVDLPATLHGLVLSRLDTLPEHPRQCVKVASVIGRTFAAGVVRAGHPDLGAEGDVLSSLQTLQAMEVAAPEDLAAAAWAFTHLVVRDVAYETLPFAQRQELHGRIAQALEAGVAGDPARWLDELAHHYWFSDDDAKKREYLLRAGTAAQDSYANDAALTSYTRLLTLLEPAEQAEVQLRVGKVHERQGDLDGAHQAYAAALDAAVLHGDGLNEAWAYAGLAEVARRRGRFSEAEVDLGRAAALFRRLGEDAGTGQVLHLSGTLAAQRGAFEEAKAFYGRSLEVRTRLDDRRQMASLLSNLAVVAEYQGDYDEAQRLGEGALALRQEVGDRWGIGISENNLGMLAVLREDAEQAKQRFLAAIALHTEVGDAWMVALGQHNLGNAHRDLGETDSAQRLYAVALLDYRAYDDAWALASLLEDVALLAGMTGRPVPGLRLVGAADAVRDQLGSPRPADVQARLEALLGHEDQTPVEDGRSLDSDGVRDLVLAVCSPMPVLSPEG